MPAAFNSAAPPLSASTEPPKTEEIGPPASSNRDNGLVRPEATSYAPFSNPPACPSRPVQRSRCFSSISGVLAQSHAFLYQGSLGLESCAAPNCGTFFVGSEVNVAECDPNMRSDRPGVFSSLKFVFLLELPEDEETPNISEATSLDDAGLLTFGV